MRRRHTPAMRSTSPRVRFPRDGGFHVALKDRAAAHAVPETEFQAARDGERRMPTGWAEHQVRATVDFARSNRLLGWYVGGLNFQVVHHLFPDICHVHYPALARIVEATCAEHGVPYRAHPTLLAAIAAHYRHLREMGRPRPALALDLSVDRAVG